VAVGTGAACPKGHEVPTAFAANNSVHPITPFQPFKILLLNERIGTNAH